jgi:hypothetical protein
MGFQIKAYYSVTKVNQYNILIEFGIHTKLVKLIQYVSIKPRAKFGHANLCLLHFLLRMV